MEQAQELTLSQCPVPIETVDERVLEGYSGVPNLLIRWEHRQLGWHDPETGEHIATFALGRALVDKRPRARQRAMEETPGPRAIAEHSRLIAEAYARLAEIEENLVI